MLNFWSQHVNSPCAVSFCARSWVRVILPWLWLLLHCMSLQWDMAHLPGSMLVHVSRACIRSHKHCSTQSRAFISQSDFNTKLPAKWVAVKQATGTGTTGLKLINFLDSLLLFPNSFCCLTNILIRSSSRFLSNMQAFSTHRARVHGLLFPRVILIPNYQPNE